MISQEKYQLMKDELRQAGDPERALQMARYMRDQFKHYGLASPVRKELCRDFLKEEYKSRQLDWDFVFFCFKDDYREMQYLGVDYVRRFAKCVTYEDLEKMYELLRTKSWWDTVDALVKVLGSLSLRDGRTKEVMLTWAQDPDFWIRRSAIEFQLGLKEQTDQELLGKIITDNLGSSEFFINKAIGWALRDYSKTNPAWVREFIEKYRSALSPLSIREGSKYL